MEVLIGLIKPSPYQPRLTFDLTELKQEIERDGLLSDLVVRKRDGFYEIIDGERRWRALKELGWKKVPVQVRDVDDRTARLTVYKLNTIRENYTTEERAKYFKKLFDGGLAAYQIGKELNVDDNWVRAHLNVFKFPEDLQNAVWASHLTLGHIRELEPVIGANIEDATRIARESLLRGLKVEETRELLKPRVEAIERARIKAAEEAVGAIAPTRVKLETPEQLEKAAEALRREARRKREEALTPKEKAALEAERKRRKEEGRRVKQEGRKREEEIRRRLEMERHRIEEQAKRKAREELLKEPEFLRVAKARAERVLPTMERESREKKEMIVREGVVFTIGEIDCDRCGRHYVIKCDGNHNWLE